MSGLLLGAALLVCSAGAAQRDLARWEGHFVFDRAASDDPNEARARALGSLGGRARRAAKEREVPPPPQWIRLEHDEASVRAETERGVRWRVCGDGTVEREGQGREARAELGDSSLAVVSTGRRGARYTEEVALHDGGERLTLRIRIAAARLPQPIEYRLVYRRDPSAAPA